MKMPGMNGLVVLVDENDDLLPVVLVQIARQIEERAPIKRQVAGAIEDRAIVTDLPLAEPVAPEQVQMLAEEDLDVLPDRPPALLVALRLRALEVEIEHRIALEVGPVLVACLPDRQILEEVRKILIALLEPAAKHRQVQRLAEAARARKDDGLDTRSIEELADQAGFVDVFELLLPERAEIVEANGDAQRHGRGGRLLLGLRGGKTHLVVPEAVSLSTTLRK